MRVRQSTPVLIEIVPGEPVLLLGGDLDVRSTGELRAAVHDHIRRCGIDRVSPVIIDVSAVRSVDATALKVLAAASRQAQQYGVRVVLRGATPAVRRMLHLTHLIRLIEVEREAVPA
ncbi:STAS domain-containing protein [Pimelobacter simplex]|uniref:Anti-sigma factor antagonist n=1 Tax=Nocardioides simplex TaxID=2045 RepID=A0A7J5DU60_NOCSI|nr:STAS domain-containing protein [Pimelobacter simplex]KAB2808857.1 STAS domain-containing protein [Pimelobacter simplex]MCG8151786.1 anti-sigma factor antagonist [Pimelobacter simplex]SFM50397.1 anti-anti-sigma factor [Pimelobacter simplex]